MSFFLPPVGLCVRLPALKGSVVFHSQEFLFGCHNWEASKQKVAPFSPHVCTKGPCLPILIQLFLYWWQKHPPAHLFTNPCSFLRWVSEAGSSGTQVEALQSELHHIRQTACTAFFLVDGGNRLLVTSFCSTSVGSYLTLKEEVISIEIVASATASDRKPDSHPGSPLCLAPCPVTLILTSVVCLGLQQRIALLFQW